MDEKNIIEESLEVYQFLAKVVETAEGSELVTLMNDKVSDIKSLIGRMRSLIIQQNGSIKSEEEVRRIMKESMSSVVQEVVSDQIELAKSLSKIEECQVLMDTISTISNGKDMISLDTVLAIIKANRAVSIRNVQQIKSSSASKAES